MKAACAAAMIALAAASPALAQPSGFDSGAIGVQLEGGNASGVITADLQDFQDDLIKSLTRTYIDNSCGDRVRADSIEWQGREDAAKLTATLHYTRWHCVAVPETICKGFACSTESRTVRRLVYKNAIPVELNITPRESGFGFVADWDHDRQYAKELLGNEEYYSLVARVFEAETQSSLDDMTNQLLQAWQTSGATRDLENATTIFQMLDSGAINLQIGVNQ